MSLNVILPPDDKQSKPSNENETRGASNKIFSDDKTLPSKEAKKQDKLEKMSAEWTA